MGRRMLFTVAALAVLVVPATALAADPTTHQYSSQLAQVSGGGAGGGTGAGGAPSNLGGLPFTGLDLGLLAAVAAALLGAGLLLRRGRVAETHE